MKTFVFCVGIVLALGSVSFSLDASNQQSAAIESAGLAIAAGLCFVAAAIARLAGNATVAPSHRKPTEAKRREEYEVPLG